MNPLSPPTDNLYKFIFIAGLLLMFAAGFKYISWSTELIKEKKEFDGYTAMVEIRDSIIRSDLKEIRQKINEPHKNPNEIQNLEMQEIDTKKKLEEHFLDSKLHEGKVIGLNTFIRQYEAFQNYLLESVAVGIILTFFGGLLWYLKLQRYEDIIIKSEANSAFKEVPKSGKQK